MNHLILALLFSASALPGKIIYGVPKSITTLNPYSIAGIESYTVTGFVLEPLTRIETRSQTLQPWLATRWEMDPKSKRVKVWLREGVPFHNGDLLSSEDVRFTWSSYFKPAYKGEAWRGMWEDVEDVKVLDERRFEVRFKKLTYQNFQNFMTALRVLPRRFYGDVNLKLWNRQIIGTGAFKLARFQEGRALELQPNPKWWGWRAIDRTPAPTIVVKPVHDTLLAGQLRARHELDIYALPPGEGLDFTPVKTSKDPFGTGLSVGFNLRNPLLADANIRRALQLAWDRGSLNKKVYSGKYKLALDSFTPETSYYPGGAPQDVDVQKARWLLAKSGFKKADEDGLLYREDAGEKTKLIFHAVLHSPESERWMGLLQADLGKIGVRLILERVGDEAEWLKAVNEGRFDLLSYEGAYSEAPHAAVWHSKGAYNSSGLKSEKVDQLLGELETEFSADKRQKLLQQLILAIREQAVEMPGLVSTDARFLLSNAVAIDETRPLEPWFWRKKD